MYLFSVITYYLSQGGYHQRPRLLPAKALSLPAAASADSGVVADIILKFAREQERKDSLHTNIAPPSVHMGKQELGPNSHAFDK